MQNVVAAIVGLVCGMIINLALVLFNTSVLYPMPDGMNLNDAAQLNAYMARLPTAAFLVVLAAHLGQAFGGGWVAARLSPSNPMALAMVVGVVSIAGGIVNAMEIDLPTWMWIEFPLYPVAAWAAGRIELWRRAQSSSSNVEYS